MTIESLGDIADFAVSSGPSIPSHGDHQWYLDEGSGSTLADSEPTGTKESATIDDPTWVADSAAVGGQKLDHTGAGGSYWEAVGVCSTPFTVCGWVNFDSMGAYANGVASDAGTGGTRYYVDSNGSGGLLTVTNGGSRIKQSFVPTGDWGFFALHMQSGDHRLVTYSNTSKLADKSSSYGVGTYSNAKLRVGWQSDGGRLDGQTDFYAVSSGSLLSDQQVTDLWNATKR